VTLQSRPLVSGTSHLISPFAPMALAPRTSEKWRSEQVGEWGSRALRVNQAIDRPKRDTLSAMPMADPPRHTRAGDAERYSPAPGLLPEREKLLPASRPICVTRGRSTTSHTLLLEIEICRRRERLGTDKDRHTCGSALLPSSVKNGNHPHAGSVGLVPQGLRVR
jgi:hypothetical protein